MAIRAPDGANKYVSPKFSERWVRGDSELETILTHTRAVEEKTRYGTSSILASEGEKVKAHD